MFNNDFDKFERKVVWIQWISMIVALIWILVLIAFIVFVGWIGYTFITSDRVQNWLNNEATFHIEFTKAYYENFEESD